MREQRKQVLLPKLRFPEFREAGEWESKPLAQVCNILQGYGFPEVLQGKSEGKYPFCKVSDISRAVAENGGLLVEATNYIGGNELLKLRAKPIPKGATVFAKIGEALRLNRRAYVQTECLIDNNATGLKAIDGVADDYFVYLLSQLIDLNKHCGGAVPSVNKSTLEEIEVVVPGPDEQKRIADCLSSIDELITTEAQKLDTLKAHKKGLMQQLFPAEGETLPKLRFPEFREVGEWESKPLAQVCNILQGYGFPEVFQGKSKGKYPFCKVSDISRAVAENGGLLVEATNYIGDDELLKLRAKPIPKGATVFAKIGEALRLNRRAYVQTECLIDNNATGLKAIDGVADDYFVYLLSQLIDLNRHCGGAVPSVNKSTLEEIEVVVPGPDEQKRIADCLSSLDDLITAQTQKLAALKAHKKGLMQQLFPSLGGVDGEAGRGGRPVVDEAQG